MTKQKNRNSLIRFFQISHLSLLGLVTISIALYINVSNQNDGYRAFIDTVKYILPATLVIIIFMHGVITGEAKNKWLILYTSYRKLMTSNLFLILSNLLLTIFMAFNFYEIIFFRQVKFYLIPGPETNGLVEIMHYSDVENKIGVVSTDLPFTKRLPIGENRLYYVQAGAEEPFSGDRLQLSFSLKPLDHEIE